MYNLFYNIHDDIFSTNKVLSTLYAVSIIHACANVANRNVG